MRAAGNGLRTLVVSTDAAHSLADAFGVSAGAQPVRIADGLHLQHVDAQARFETSWSQIQSYLLDVLEVVGVDPLAADELTVLPGAEEVFALLEVRAQILSGHWDAVIVDCAPTAETLRLLALPEALGWYMTRILPAQRRMVRALRPVLTKAAGVPMPQDSVFDALARLHGDLAEVHRLLSGPAASVRLVLTPERVVLAEARRSLTMLSLFGYRVDGAVVNRVFPSEASDPWVRGWAQAQADVMTDVADSFADVSVWTAPYASGEPVGLPALGELADCVYGNADPLAVAAGAESMRVIRTESGSVLTLRLPLVDSSEVRLARDGDDLVVSVASYRRLLTLPPSLARCRVVGARVRTGELQVRFADPDSAEPDQEVSG